KPQFSVAHDFHDGLSYVYSFEFRHEVFIDNTGKIIINNPELGNYGDFSEGLASAQNGWAKYGYIDKTGKIIIPPQFDFTDKFSEGLARVKIGNRWGFI